MRVTTVFCASNLGGSEPRVLARFVTDKHGLQCERFDRRAGRWIRDARVAGYLSGSDDWAERIDPEAAGRLLESWGYGAALRDAPAAEVAST